MHCGVNNPFFNYIMNGDWLEQVKTEKDLGITIDYSLKFSVHALNAPNKANRMLGFIKRNVSYKSKFVILTLYNAFVRPHLDYCLVSILRNPI